VFEPENARLEALVARALALVDRQTLEHPDPSFRALLARDRDHVRKLVIEACQRYVAETALDGPPEFMQ
jgi:hypothetical protein